MQSLSCTGESRHHRSNWKLKGFGDLPIGEILKIKEDHWQAMSFIKLSQRLMKCESIGTEGVAIFRLIEHLVNGDLILGSIAATHLAMTVPQDTDEPPLYQFRVTKARPRTICLEKSLLRQLFCICPRTGPPISDTEEKPLVLSYPVVEHLIVDLHNTLSFRTCPACCYR